MEEIFYKTFLKTTDPYTDYIALASFEVIFCILINLVFYAGAYFILMKLFGFPKKMMQVVIGLVVIMILGYIGRLARVKSMYNVLRETYEDEEKAHKKATKQLRNAYFTWYFLS
jgi:Na+/melibiose symporter-like transporter